MKDNKTIPTTPKSNVQLPTIAPSNPPSAGKSFADVVSDTFQKEQVKKTLELTCQKLMMVFEYHIRYSDVQTIKTVGLDMTTSLERVIETQLKHCNNAV